MARQGDVDGEAGYRPGYSKAAERILQYIEEQGFGPGDRLLTEAEFARVLELSRTMTRDALKTLAATGHITTQRGRGIFVAESSPTWTKSTSTFEPTGLEHIMMLLEFRGIHERAGAEFAAERATPAELVIIENALTDYAHNVPTRDIARLTSCDEAFHVAISRASHNDFIVDSVGSAITLQRKVVAAAFGGFSGGPLSKALEEHTAIFDAIRRGDKAAAGMAALAHMDRTKLDYREEIGRRVFQSDS